MLIKSVTPPIAYYEAFSGPTYYHTILYIPTGSWDAYSYDNELYNFINIRETAMTEEEVSARQAYTLMDANTFAYSVYDPVNDCIGTIGSVGAIDENNPNHCWQVIEHQGNRYLYNIGAKKFAVSSPDGKTLKLTDVATPVGMENGKDGVVIDGQADRQWALVNNDRMAVEQEVIEHLSGISSLSASQRDKRYYDLYGRKQEKQSRGLNILRMGDGTTRKVLKK